MVNFWIFEKVDSDDFCQCFCCFYVEGIFGGPASTVFTKSLLSSFKFSALGVLAKSRLLVIGLVLFECQGMVLLMPKAQLLCTALPKLNLKGRVLSGVEKNNSFITLLGKGGHSKLLP